ncbi:MAG: hypothetical protein AAF740_03325 [Bacteroidota bacterium]
MMILTKKTERFLMLYGMYRKASGNPYHMSNAREMATQEGMSYRSFKSAFDYLCREKLIRPETYSLDSSEYYYQACLTDEGIRAVEAVFEDENRSTKYFPPYRRMMV